MKRNNDFIPNAFDPLTGKTTWESPSNIALVKYWGKYGQQLPSNPSISFTLSHCKTITEVAFSPKEKQGDGFSFDFLFEGKETPAFHPKIEAFFERILPYAPYIKDHHLAISSKNTFPHSSGIASSASGMSAMALGILSIEHLNNPMDEDSFYKKASFLARLGSGSAARSIQGPMMSWGKTAAFSGSSDDFASPYAETLHPVFTTYKDTILLIDQGQKKVSSTVGHNLMKNNPYAPARFEQAHTHMKQLKSILESGDVQAFIPLVESEALTLHALMMASQPAFILMHPNTLTVLNKVEEFRQDTGLHLCFTLDAGANVHLLYPQEEEQPIAHFIKTELAAFCQEGQYIDDEVGTGAKKV